MLTWLKNWFSHALRIAELEREKEELSAGLEQTERELDKAQRALERRRSHKAEVRRLNKALRLRALELEVVRAEARWLREELKKRGPLPVAVDVLESDIAAAE